MKIKKKFTLKRMGNVMKKNYFVLAIACVCFCFGVVGIEHTQVRAQEIEAASKPCFANNCYNINYDCRPKSCFVSGVFICFDGNGNLLFEGSTCKILGKENIKTNSYAAKIDCDGDKKADYGWSFKFNKDECGGAIPCAKVTGKVSFYDKGKKTEDCKLIGYARPPQQSPGKLESSRNFECLKSPLD